LVLTQLLLNGMLKVKGHIADIALRITDEEERISGLAKLFFTELGRKANALYNVLPDIISRLSDVELKLDEDKYRTILGHIFSLVQKDRQVEALVDKLLSRLGGCDTPRQWRDITFCLHLLHHNEKCVKRMLDLFPNFKDKLHEPDVYRMFVAIIAKARKNLRTESKGTLDQLSERVEECHAKAVEMDDVASKAAMASKGGRRGNVRVVPKRRKNFTASDSEDSGDDFAAAPSKAAEKEDVRRPQRASVRKSARFSDEEEEVQQTKKGSSRKKGRVNGNKESSSEEEEEESDNKEDEYELSESEEEVAVRSKPVSGKKNRFSDSDEEDNSNKKGSNKKGKKKILQSSDESEEEVRKPAKKAPAKPTRSSRR